MDAPVHAPTGPAGEMIRSLNGRSENDRFLMYATAKAWPCTTSEKTG